MLWTSGRLRLALLAALGFASFPAQATPVLNASEGHINFYKHTGSADDVYTTNPTQATIQFMNAHWPRLTTWSGYWDQGNKLSWYSNAWVYFDSYAIYSDPNNTFYAQLLQQHPDWVLRDSSGNPLYINYDCN